MRYRRPHDKRIHNTNSISSKIASNKAGIGAIPTQGVTDGGDIQGSKHSRTFNQ